MKEEGISYHPSCLGAVRRVAQTTAKGTISCYPSWTCCGNQIPLALSMETLVHPQYNYLILRWKYAFHCRAQFNCPQPQGCGGENCFPSGVHSSQYLFRGTFSFLAVRWMGGVDPFFVLFGETRVPLYDNGCCSFGGSGVVAWRLPRRGV